MELRNQVCSLEYAKRLKELGVKQESLWWWHSPLPHYGYNDWSLSDCELGHGSESFSAFTVAELGEMLPALNITGWVMTEKLTSDWHVAFCTSTGYEKFAFDALTEADARCLMLIHLLKNKLITL